MNEAPNRKPFMPTEHPEKSEATLERPAADTAPTTEPATPATPPAAEAAPPATPSVTDTQPVPSLKPAESAASPAAPTPVPAAPPAPEPTPTPAAVPAAPTATTVTDPSEAHVLVVEDNVPNFVLIARMLAFMGVQRCEWKTSGWQVVQFADTLPRVDLILMDIRLPYEDGYQALQKLRANARLKDTVVCAVTAEASEDQMRRAKKAGFNGFLGKPLDPDRFPNQIRRLLAGEEVWEWN